MIYFLHGEYSKVVGKAGQMVEAMLAKKPDALVVKINAENFSEGLLSEMVGGQALFSQKYIVQLSKILDDPATADSAMKFTKEMAESENIFIWCEESVKKAELKKIEKVATKIQEFSASSKKDSPKKMPPNIFSLGSAIGARDKKKIWTIFVELSQHFSPEEIYGTMWWQFKTILLAAKTKSAKEAGMKDFPYSQAKKYLQNYSEQEIADLSEKLIVLYHQSRLDGEELAINLEKFVLGI